MMIGPAAGGSIWTLLIKASEQATVADLINVPL